MELYRRGRLDLGIAFGTFEFLSVVFDLMKRDTL